MPIVNTISNYWCGGTQRRIYQNEYPYFVTFRVREAYPLFEKTEYVVLLAKVIFKTSSIKKYDVLAYQIMTDHIHVLVYNKFRAHPAVGALRSKMGSAGRAACARRFTISELMHGIKSYYCDTIRDQYNIAYPIFQKRFYARVVDNHKYLETVIQYIQQNPIKENLPQKYHQPPYQYFDWNKINNLF